MGERSGDGGQPAEGGGRPWPRRKATSRDNALQGDGARAPRDCDRIRNAIEPIDEDHDIGRLGRRARAARAHGDADVGRRQGRSIIDAVADHQGRIEPLLACDGVDLVGGNAIGEHVVEVERGADRLGRVGAIARSP